MSSERGSPKLPGAPGLHAIGESEFHWLCDVVKAAAGIHLTVERAPMIKVRLARRMRATRSSDMASYIELVRNDASCTELWAMIDALTVNRTCFFREADHFPIYVNALRELLAQERPVSVWSAGCATGEEPFTLAMLAQTLGAERARRVRVLATDISARAINIARAGLYPRKVIEQLPPPLHAHLEPADDGNQRVRVVAAVRNQVSFARHNLIGAWQMHGPMDVIFCRNVLIYFNPDTQSRVVDNFFQLLAPGGYLFLGHTEMLSGTRFEYVQPAVYRKPLPP